MDSEKGPDLGDFSLSKEIQEIYSCELFEETSEQNDMEVIAFLTSTHGDNEDVLDIPDQPEFTSPSDRIFLDHDCGGETGLKIPAELVSHLSKEDRAEFIKIVKKYPDVWAKTKYIIGHFKGFKCQIPTIPGKTAIQKERTATSFSY